MPMAVILLAIGGSFVSHASGKKIQQVVPGYATTNPARPCDVSIPCSTNPANPICTLTIGTTTYQAFGRLTPTEAVPCPIVLRRVNP